MKKPFLILALICTVLFPLAGGAQNMPTTIKVQGLQMANAFMKNDFPAFLPFMHPNVIAFAGGKEEMKAKMDSAQFAMKRFNVTFRRYWIGSPGPIVSYKNQLQSILPASTTVRTAFGELTVETSMLVISADKGRHWWFIDTNVYRAEKLKDILPDLSPALVIPPRKKPKMTPLQ